MTPLAKRIVDLEQRFLQKKSNMRLISWCDDDADDLETVIERDRLQSGHTGGYYVVKGVSGQWKDVPGRGTVWVRPPRAEARYRRQQEVARPALPTDRH